MNIVNAGSLDIYKTTRQCYLRSKQIELVSVLHVPSILIGRYDHLLYPIVIVIVNLNVIVFHCVDKFEFEMVVSLCLFLL